MRWDQLGNIQTRPKGVGSMELNNQVIESCFVENVRDWFEGKDGLGTSLNGFFKEGMLTGCSSGPNEESCFVEKIRRGQSILGG
jgi:hypothetical protein